MWTQAQLECSRRGNVRPTAEVWLESSRWFLNRSRRSLLVDMSVNIRCSLEVYS